MWNDCAPIRLRRDPRGLYGSRMGRMGLGSRRDARPCVST